MAEVIKILRGKLACQSLMAIFGQSDIANMA